MKNKKGFTLIELLAVIIILGVLMLIAIPSVTEYIGVAKRKSYIATAKEYIGAVANKVNSLDIPITDTNTTYYVPIASIDLESGGKSPYGEWTDGYVVVTTDGTNNNYYWTSLDENGNAVLLTEDDKLTNDSITTNVDELDLNVGVGDRENIVVFNEDGSVKSTGPALTLISDGGSITEGTTTVPLPVITLIGQASLEVTFGSTYNDQGATATDDKDGNITASIVVTNGVDTNTAGVQYVRYNVTNSKGIKATEVVRTVTVVNPVSNPGYLASEGVNAPVLLTGLTAIKWNSGSSTWDTVADPSNDTSWYDYANKQWANAKSADGSFWVWIPRYAYQIVANYHVSPTTPGNSINIKFLKNKTNVASDDSTIGTTATYSGASQTNYIVHPAFTFGTNEIPGIWVAKFEPTAAEGVATGATTCVAADNVSTKTVKIIPNANTWRCMNIDNAFNAAVGMKNNSTYGWPSAFVDTHMMKNIEWGAVAYLTQSTYGKNSLVAANTVKYTTGCSTSSANTYDTASGQTASTTGNIYGIYDMSGSAEEFVAGYVDNATARASVMASAALKYRDVYTLGSGDTMTTNYDLMINRKGEAVYETSDNGANLDYSWYDANSLTPYSVWPFFARGGNGSMSGNKKTQFSFNYAYTDGNDAKTFRPVLLVGSNL